eukprot:maker-scaffold488_size158317-snap-gene-0.28 protein:Tk09358 transcript:maker-scaffold488_size158317-snap-gene-0.28-mRNA-1 annotation:"gem-associated protein 2 isoform x1"
MAYGHGLGRYEDHLMRRALGPAASDTDSEDEARAGSAEGSEAQDGFQFLRQARQEAQKLPDVALAPNMDEILKRAQKPPEPQFVNRRKSQLPEKYAPSPDWQSRQVADFSETRTRLVRHLAWIRTQPLDLHPPSIPLPARADERGWAIFCHGTHFWDQVRAARAAQSGSDEDTPSSEDPEPASTDPVAGHPPLTNVFFHMRPNVVATLVEYHVHWCELFEGLRPEMALWVYSLLANLAKPLHPDTGSSIRTLALMASRQRLAMIDDERVGSITSLTLIICIVAKYFSQADLADE